MSIWVTAASLLVFVLWPSSSAFAQTSSSDSLPRTWTFRATLIGNFLPDETDYLQPIASADRGALHLEGRYNYEDLESVSGFAGWNYETGSKFTLALTPMFGGVVGRTDGVIPALEFTLGHGRLELYSESEYVLGLREWSDTFFYNWSELSLSAVGPLSVGLVTQRTKLIDNSRDLQRGPFIRLEMGRIEGSAYFFNPGSDDRYFIGSLAVAF